MTVQKKIFFFNKNDLLFKNKVTNAKVIISNFLVCTISTGHIGPLFRGIFPNNACITTTIANEMFASHDHEYHVKYCQSCLFSCDTDGNGNAVAEE